MKNKKLWLVILLFIISFCALSHNDIKNINIIENGNVNYLEGNTDPFAYMDYETHTRSHINGEDVSSRTGLELKEALFLPYFLDSYLSRFDYNDFSYNINYVNDTYEETDKKKVIVITLSEVPSLKIKCEYRIKDRIWSFQQEQTPQETTKLNNEVVTTRPIVINTPSGDYYNSVNTVVHFDSNIDTSDVGTIEVTVSDGDNNSKKLYLSLSNNYKSTETNTFTYSDLNVNTYYAKSEYYSISSKVDYSDDENPTVNIYVTKKGSSASEETTTNEAQNNYSDEEIDEARKAVKDRNSRYSVYKVIFLAILIFIVVVLCIAGIKILNANK